MAYGVVEYNQDGLPKCEICGEHFKRVITHARQVHLISEREYKKQFGLDLKKGICSKESSSKSRQATMANYDQCVASNLIEKGSESRFNNGNMGRTRDKVSAQTRARLKARLKEPYMVEAMKESGRKVGKSGLGNAKRWSFKKD